jgi:hypothetical protein
MPFRGRMFVAGWSIASICAFAACLGGPVGQPSYRISVSGTDNQVTASSNGPETLFEVTSETGLGSAVIEQVAGASPENVTFRLHLRGLEEFNFEYHDVRVVVAVSSHGDRSVSESLFRGDSAETAIGPDSPYWMPVQVFADPASGNQESPSYFEVGAPNEYIGGKYRSFSIRWIDFYR